MTQDDQKRAAAEAAVALVQNGMLVGLGSGSTAAFAIEALSRRVRQGLDIEGIPTSEKSAAQARQGGIRLTSFAEHKHLDLTIDGADEIERGTLNLIKGLGGAMLRGKVVAAASRRLVIVADGSKLVGPGLGTKSRLPVEVAAFGWEVTADRISRLGGAPALRKEAGGEPFRTDGGNLILDCDFGRIGDPAALETDLSMITGVVETGLFIGMAECALVAHADSVQEIRRS
jgi:ribose 5-phosphate isomerase A